MRALILVLTLAGVTSLTWAETSGAESRRTTAPVTFKFAEKFTRSHKKIKEKSGFPFFQTVAPRSRIEQHDKGNFNIVGVLQMPGVDVDLLGPKAETVTTFTIGCGNFLTSVSMNGDPKWIPGRQKATITEATTFNGKNIIAFQIKLAWSDKDLKFSVKGNYAGADSSFLGENLVAKDYLSNSGEVAGVEAALVSFGSGAYGFTSDAILVPFGGAVSSTPFGDTTFKNLKMGFAGTNAP